jgi:hypothetical protein
MLEGRGERAVLFTVATADPGGRLPGDIRRWEQDYGWPVGHRADNGDLRNGEIPFFFDVQEPFNARRGAIRGVLLNQFGWCQERCGQRMPPQLEFAHLRYGTDLEFGQSIYEPFGIAQIEPVAAGALSVVSDVCGCTGFLQQTRASYGGLIVADYTALPTEWLALTAWDALWIDRPVRDAIEALNSKAAAEAILARLPRDDAGRRTLFDEGGRVAEEMSWDIVMRDFVLPPLQRIADCL